MIKGMVMVGNGTNDYILMVNHGYYPGYISYWLM